MLQGIFSLKMDTRDSENRIEISRPHPEKKISTTFSKFLFSSRYCMSIAYSLTLVTHKTVNA